VGLESAWFGGYIDELECALNCDRCHLSGHSFTATTPLNLDDAELRYRIGLLIESVKDDRARTNQLFQYVWTLICVRRGLMRLVRIVHGEGSRQLIVEEVQTGRLRIVGCPPGLDPDIEGLAVQALARILSDVKPWDRRQASM
jgi:hypothetical protein